METPFELLLLTPENDIEGELAISIQLFNMGLMALHLRKPHWDAAKTQHFLEAIPNEFHHRIVLHSHFPLADKFNLKGIHLNETNKKLIQQFDKYKIISASFHSLQDIRENTFSYQYIFLSPVFNSISKPGYESKFYLQLVSEELDKIRQENHSGPPIIALGGINAENIIKTKSAGFAGAALLGAIWESANPVETFRHIRSEIEAK
jgi:thiamine-phosphate pyrophosphorylase